MTVVCLALGCHLAVKRFYTKNFLVNLQSKKYSQCGWDLPGEIFWFRSVSCCVHDNFLNHPKGTIVCERARIACDKKLLRASFSTIHKKSFTFSNMFSLRGFL